MCLPLVDLTAGLVCVASLPAGRDQLREQGRQEENGVRLHRRIHHSEYPVYLSMGIYGPPQPSGVRIDYWTEYYSR